MEHTRLIPVHDVPKVRDLSECHAFNLIRSGKLPAQRINGRLYVKVGDVLALKIRNTHWLRTPQLEPVITYKIAESPKPQAVEPPKELVEA